MPKCLYLVSHLTEQCKCLLLELTDLQVVCYFTKSSNGWEHPTGKGKGISWGDPQSIGERGYGVLAIAVGQSYMCLQIQTETTLPTPGPLERPNKDSSGVGDWLEGILLVLTKQTSNNNKTTSFKR